MKYRARDSTHQWFQRKKRARQSNRIARQYTLLAINCVVKSFGLCSPFADVAPRARVQHRSPNQAKNERVGPG